MTISPVLPRAAGTEYGHGLRAAIQLVRDVEPQPVLAETVSPELALVCPELRERALLLLPDLDPDGPVPVRRHLVPLGDVSDLDDVSEQPPHACSRRDLAVAATAYLAVEAAQVAAVGAAVMGSLAGVITLGTLLAG